MVRARQRFPGVMSGDVSGQQQYGECYCTQVAQAMWLAGVHLEQYCKCFVFICIPYCLYSGGDTFREEVEMMIWSQHAEFMALTWTVAQHSPDLSESYRWCPLYLVHYMSSSTVSEVTV